MIHSDQGEEDKKTNLSQRRKKSHSKPASTNTGGGGGGGAANGATPCANGTGGSGIVIVRYAINTSNDTINIAISSNGINQTVASVTNVLMSRLGVGTNNPSEKLHVRGNLRVDGTNIITALNFGSVTRTNWPTGYLFAVSNLLDVANYATARANLGLGTAATNNASAFASTGSVYTLSTTFSSHTNYLSNPNPHHVTTTQIGALTPTGDGSQLTGITATQVGALTPAGNGSQLTGITAAQVGALTPAGNGSQLTGITAAQVGALTPTGNGSQLTGITAAQVGALTPAGNGSQLTNITAAQVGALSTTGGVVNGLVSFTCQFGDVPMGVFTNR